MILKGNNGYIFIQYHTICSFIIVYSIVFDFVFCYVNVLLYLYYIFENYKKNNENKMSIRRFMDCIDERRCSFPPLQMLRN